MKLENAHPTKKWLSIALAYGYYDYQHLVRDYKEFTKLTPTEFAQKESHAPERAFGNAETTLLLTDAHDTPLKNCHILPLTVLKINRLLHNTINIHPLCNAENLSPEPPQPLRLQPPP